MLIGSWIGQPHSPCPSIYGLSGISVHVNTNTTGYAGNKILASLPGFSLAAFINVFPVKLLSHWLSQLGEISCGLSLAAEHHEKGFYFTTTGAEKK